MDPDEVEMDHGPQDCDSGRRAAFVEGSHWRT